jgi:hypothetical protein
MAVLVTLVLLIAVSATRAVRSISRAVDTETGALLAGTEAGSGLVGAVLNEIRSAEQYLLDPSVDLQREFIASGDSAYAYQQTFRQLTGLSTQDRYITNKIADEQSTIEVSYALAHALADLGRDAEARRHADQARAPADTLVADVRALSRSQSARALIRIQALQQEASRRERNVWALFALARPRSTPCAPWTCRFGGSWGRPSDSAAATSAPSRWARCRPSSAGSPARWMRWRRGSARWWASS